MATTHRLRTQGSPGGATVERRSWSILALALVAQVLVVLDISVVNMALPTIGSALHLASGDMQWLVVHHRFAVQRFRVHSSDPDGGSRGPRPGGCADDAGCPVDHHDDVLRSPAGPGTGVVGAIGGLGVAAGVIVGGALTTWAGWQMIFWVNVPIGVVALVVALKILPKELLTAPAWPSSTSPEQPPPSPTWQR